jgi:N-methylhydantoinase B
MNDRIDPITFEVIKNGLDSAADQAAITLMRSAYSSLVRDSLDYSTAVFDGAGRLVAQGLTTPFHIGSFPDAMECLLSTYGDEIVDGDVFLLNDPYGSGGMHLPDFYVIKPVFFDGRRVGFVTTLAHQQDVGGITPGSNAVHATEIYQEGLRIPLIKLFDGGRPNSAVFAIIAKNSRVPREIIGDVRAQLAGCGAAEHALRALCSRYGVDELARYCDALIEYSERAMRRALREVPNGTYCFEDYIDGLGAHPEPIVFRVRVEVGDDSMTVDWTGTSPQVDAGINAPFPFTKSATYLAARVLVREDLPNSAGYLVPLTTVAPAGTIVNPVEPAACAARGIIGMRCFDTILGALAKALPDRIPACGEGGVSWPTIGGYVNGAPFVYAESLMGSWGGRPTHDGTEGITHPGANQPNQPVEMIEATKPLLVRRYGYVPDTGGAGRYRGGLSIVKEYEILAERAVLTIRSDKRDHPPYGLQGGNPGTGSFNWLSRDGETSLLPVLPMEAVRLEKGDIFTHILPGGGGWGDPLERDPARCLRDVLDGKLTAEYVQAQYGVVLLPEGSSVDLEATEMRRAALRRDRPGRQA